MLLIAENDGIYLAQSFDLNRTPPNEQITVREAARENLHGGIPAILTWGVPLLAALLAAIYLIVVRRRSV